MEDHFVTYSQAVALKKLGFNEPCIAFFSHEVLVFHTHGIDPHFIFKKNSDIWDSPSATLKQQAILFLLNKCDDLHGAELSIEYFGDESGILKNYGGNFNSLSQAIDKLIMLANDKMP
jgi:hypothetical protein